MHGEGFAWIVSGFGTSQIEPVIAKLPADGIALDVGANIGTWTRLISARLTHGSVYAFEPSPGTFKGLENNCRSIANIQCVQLALGARCGEAFLSDEMSSGQRHIVADGQGAAVKVRITTVEEWVTEAKLPKIDFIKIDVEGFEEDVLIPARNVILTFMPIMCFEFIRDVARRRSSYHGEALFPFLADLGYTVMRLDKDGRTFEDFGAPRDWTNDYLAVPPSDAVKGMDVLCPTSTDSTSTPISSCAPRIGGGSSSSAATSWRP